MKKRVAVITVHGMGDTNPSYHKELEGKLINYVGRDRWQDNVHLESVFYQKHLQENQRDYWNDIDDEYSLKWDFLRKFMLFSFSDAASIEHSLRNDMSLYLAVHGEIAAAFDGAYEALEDEHSPVVIVSHSLGCEQISNYIWDSRNDKRFFETDKGSAQKKAFRRLSSCYRLYTTGCNIPIFRAGIEKPELFSRPNSRFRWKNYFDAHDVLAYPLKNMSEDYTVAWLHDKKVEVGGLMSGWNPMSHQQYWTDKDVLKPIARDIRNLID